MRTRAASIVLLVSLVMVSGGRLFAAGVTHLACAAKGHGCARVPILTQCCCGEHGDDVLAPPVTTTDRDDVMPAAALRVGVGAAVVPLPPVPPVFHTVGTSPPLDHHLDLPVLFSDLRL